MAGRRPRPARDGSPLAPSKSVKQLRPRRGPASGSWIDGEWVPEPETRAYRDDGFQPGEDPPNAFDEENDFATVHGAHSERALAPRALAFVTSMLEDAASPEHLRSPAFRSAVLAWGRAEAAASLLFDYISGMEMEGLITPRLAATKAPVDTWRSLEAHAAGMRSKLGIDPVVVCADRERPRHRAESQRGRPGAAVRDRRGNRVQAAGNRGRPSARLTSPRPWSWRTGPGGAR